MTGQDTAIAQLVVPLHAEHVADIARVHAACFDETWDASMLRRILVMPGAFGIGVRRGVAGELVGFAIGRMAADECELLSLGVLPANRGQGLGAMLLDAALVRACAVKARKFFLEVAEDNAPALALYSARGLAQVGRRRNYYEHDDGSFTDALTLRRDLP
jgi:[ribosomal protein S18]-alanine N-acetyltransferase